MLEKGSLKLSALIARLFMDKVVVVPLLVVIVFVKMDKGQSLFIENIGLEKPENQFT